MDINFEYYKIFYYVAKYCNFTKAARALGNSQMCIRDRDSSDAKTLEVASASIDVSSLGGSNAMPIEPEPVSYTHLDVYKRQGQTSTRRS